ncbi:MAG TPA: hypothetical protein VIL84_13290 [Devosiaceae bacterium]
MNRDQMLYAVIGVLALAVVVLGVLYIQERQNNSSIDVKLGNGGISIQTK